MISNIRKISYKNQKKIAFVLLFFITVIIYNLSLKKTINLYFLCNEISKKGNELENSSKELENFELELIKLENAINVIDTNKGAKDARQILLEMSSKYCSQNEVIIKEMPAQVVIEKNDYKIITNSIILQGTFLKLLGFVYLIENSNCNNVLLSVDFKINKDIINNKKNLNLIIYAQNIIKK
ncbi:MAG: hypothetical protein A2X12_05475 [Bacteroidetes bacterium GWE2_29_8]|nr:MAG: hypothetical protein A2X12_05475 [Bacteroidetes bacterium GWE2_29_8]